MLVKSIPCLAFVPPNEVLERFEDLVKQFDEIDEGLEDFLTYFKTNYIEAQAIRRNVNREPRFPINLWNHFDDARDCLPKTTNCVESFHNALRSLFLSPHPTIWSMFEGLRKDMNLHRLTVQNYQVQRVEKQRPKYLELAQRLSEKVVQYYHEENKIRYLRSVAHLQA